MTSRTPTFHTIDIVRPQRTLKMSSYKVNSFVNSNSKKSLRNEKSLIQTNQWDFVTEQHTSANLSKLTLN